LGVTAELLFRVARARHRSSLVDFRAGFRTEIVTKSSDVVAKSRALQPAVITLDILLLEREGYQVELPESSEEALERLGACTPDLILMDVQLPGMDGLSLTRALKSAPETAAIPVVALTAHAMIGDREQALAAGCAAYVSKPIDTGTLGEEVRKFLNPVAGGASPIQRVKTQESEARPP
jgi:two-component system cell cycle response regulator DivK